MLRGRARRGYASSITVLGMAVAAQACSSPPPKQFVESGVAAGLDWRQHPRELGAFDAYDHGNGLAAGDFDGDGHADLLLLTQCGPTGYFLGNGDGTFRDRSERVSMLDDAVRVAVTYGDYDADGDVDFFVTNVRHPNALLRQEEDGTFTNVAELLGVANVGHYTGAAFGDFDRDGDLDLVVAGSIQFTTDMLVERPGCPLTPVGVRGVFGVETADPSLLLVNAGAAGGFVFRDEALARGLPPAGSGMTRRGFGGLAVSDYDRDGDLDLLFLEMFGGLTALLDNDGAGHFTDVTATRIPQPSFGTAGGAIADFDGDGWPDIFMVDMHSDMYGGAGSSYADVEPEVRYRGRHPRTGIGDNETGPLYGNSLWMHPASGATYREAAQEWHAETFQPWGVTTGDFDNDGDLDAFIPSGMSNPFDYWPNAFLVNEGTRFVERAHEVGLDTPPGGRTDGSILHDGQPLTASTRSAVTADFDEDGDLDLAVISWSGRVLLYRNHVEATTHWLDVHVVGRAPREAHGAEVEVDDGARVQVRQVETASGYLSQSSELVHFGLGSLTSIARVSVRWPDGTRTEVASPAVDQRLTITQP